MKGLLRSKFVVVGMAALFIVAALAFSLGATGVIGTRVSAAGPTFKGPSHTPAKGELDCNGFSSTGQKPLKRSLPCTDLNGITSDEGHKGVGEDNGHYIGHDEPTTQFNSNVPGSGNNMQYTVALPKEHPLPATQTFENQIAFWFSMAMCDPKSYPQAACTPDSDTNTPTLSGSAFEELQFYPPGFAPFSTQISCDKTHWCGALTIDSLECTTGFGVCNAACEEPVNFAFLQTNGVPAGPPGPSTATAATFTPNANTLLMNQGDVLKVTLVDTNAGLKTVVNDLTTHQSGFMVASAANGFQNTDINTCAGTNFSFHPEYSTAKFGNDVPWAALQANIGFADEIGHFQPGPNGDNDSDDAPCFPKSPTSILAGCIGADLDFDGTSYQRDWPNGTSSTTATPVQFTSPLSAATGDSWYRNTYPIMQFETDIPASETTCTPTGIGCTVPPPGGKFYPFYSISKWGGVGGCTFLFGNNTTHVNDLGQDAQYGTPYLPYFFGTSSSGPRENPCTSA